jgi:hypothetical protein
MRATQREMSGTRAGFDKTTPQGTAGWLCLAAAPTFALMALLTAFGGGPADILCSATQGAFGGMVPMYVLMSVFHATPWLRLAADWRKSRARP